MTDRQPLTLRAMEDRAIADDRPASSWGDRWSRATADATWQELGEAHDAAHWLVVSAASAISDRLVVLGADRWGISARYPEVLADVAWCVGLWKGKPHVYYTSGPEAPADPRDWWGDDIDTEEPEARRVQVLDGVTLVLTTGKGQRVLSNALRLAEVPECLRGFA